jgi:hypothetical protein
MSCGRRMASEANNRAAEGRRAQLLRRLVKSTICRVEFGEVREELYNGVEKGKKQFDNDGKKLAKELGNRRKGVYAHLAELCDVLRFPLPEIQFKDGALRSSCPFRGFLRDLYADPARESKLRLVKGVLERKGIVPEGGSLYLGVGKTVFLLAWELLSQPNWSYDVHTANMEIASLVYLWPCDRNPLFVRGSEVNHKNGGLKEERALKVDTAIVSVDAIKKDGKMYSANADDSQQTSHAIAAAEDRVIVLIDHTKFLKPHYTVDKQISLPKASEGKTVYLVTDEAPRDFVPPQGVQLVDLGK